MKNFVFARFSISFQIMLIYANKVLILILKSLFYPYLDHFFSINSNLLCKRKKKKFYSYLKILSKNFQKLKLKRASLENQ